MTQPTEQVLPIRAPRAGELTSAWRIATAVVWLTVIVALGSVWNVSEQLGHATWWLGPRSARHARPIQLIPFVPAVLMLLGAINRVRSLHWFGVAAGAAVVGVGLGDLGRMRGLAIVEILIGVAAAIFSVASRGGTYRNAAGPADPV